MTIIPQCLDCNRYHRESGRGAGPMTCDAFPDDVDGIPEPILLNDHDHATPYPGDRGIRFTAIPGPAPSLPAST